MSGNPKPGKYAEEDQAIAQLREALKQRFPMPDPAPRKKRLKTTHVGLLSLALLAAVAWLDPAYHSEHYLTQVGQRQTLQLADGSQVVLDSASELDVSWHLLSRRSELRRGQALFEVSPRVYRPFLVDAGPAQVRVVGTRFNVSRYDSDVRVTVAEGRVAVRAGEASSLLEPGQQVRVHEGRLEPVAQVDAHEVGAWRNGQLIFESTPLTEVIGVIQRYHPQPIRLTGAGLDNLPVSGVFDSAHVERLLTLLPVILPLTVNTAADGSVLIAPRVKK
ncbi:FecR family protein [Pseudomonas sp. Marseille-P9899]|uniref:FecR family protein n=1 Tax=Pseudomonas sp. Marseille-P9899 TaxID=2730401 RepID=UPI00158E6A16|nr:FecR domain-containing protein [Pseudomonas sp. Marseille-P9899]